MSVILVSACLLGCSCRYDGVSKPNERVIFLTKNNQLIPVCPEQLGGLPTPRLPSECRKNGVYMKDLANVTAQFERGANETVRLAKLFQIDYAILKSKSPSCGLGKIYDGTFSKTLINGNGIAAQKLLENGFKVVSENDI